MARLSFLNTQSKKLLVVQSRTDAHFHSFFPSAIKLWYKLPQLHYTQSAAGAALHPSKRLGVAHTVNPTPTDVNMVLNVHRNYKAY